MKWIGSFLLFLLLNNCEAALLVFDDFNDGSFSTDKWVAYRPQGSSQVFESGGFLVMQQRGGIDSLNTLPSNIDISGSFRFTGSEDHFGIVIRSGRVS